MNQFSRKKNEINFVTYSTLIEHAAVSILGLIHNTVPSLVTSTPKLFTPDSDSSMLKQFLFGSSEQPTPSPN